MNSIKTLKIPSSGNEDDLVQFEKDLNHNFMLLYKELLSILKQMEALNKNAKVV